ncbi:MAG: transcriptional repressor [Chlorobiaceae bacterium]|nr:transcriptional repressor [Chlorobiaceae bacterium]
MKRKTRQREIIKHLFQSEGRPLNPLEILSLAKYSFSGLSLATVYRAIKELVEEEWLITVEVPGLSLYYEINHHQHHHHFYCSACRKVFEVEGCVPVDGLTPKGFLLESHEILLSGRCSGCIPS